MSNTHFFGTMFNPLHPPLYNCVLKQCNFGGRWTTLGRATLGKFFTFKSVEINLDMGVPNYTYALGTKDVPIIYKIVGAL